MALEAVVFQQDPFSFGSKDFYSSGGSGSGPCSYNFGFQQEEEKAYGTEETLAKSRGVDFSATWGSSPSLMVQHQPLKEWDSNSSSPDNGFLSCGFSPAEPPAGAMSCRRKRRRTKSVKNKEDIENQRMTHIAVERNRRRQMNDYLAVLKSMMPASYVQRGDQASIIGGAINFVKELEQLLQSLEARKRMGKRSDNSTLSSLFSDFFSFPQYSTGSTSTHRSCAAATSGQSMAEKRSSSVADVEVTMVESHANLKILSKRHPKQLLKMVAGLHSLGLYVLHLNVTSVEHMVLYSLSVKVEDNCQLTTVNEIAAAVYEMVDRFQEEAAA
ncbi:transcription factor bHLH94-like isoform X1 [Herrania umbratica]|uniref:Transcription factor bHLH94-like isoform X1 n=1 Tax=Herrania umbratica TaxID=108875 RepID=A0A6J0ZHB1_9ROSI|nr:transcription factor bHLH94-like isoform X1 [Herrania umbratica]